MYNAKYIIPGLVIFLALVLFPFYKSVGSPPMKVEQELQPQLEQLKKEGKTCILEKNQMRDSHMILLNQWRDAALRDGVRVFTNPDGKKFDISLTNTCLQCHAQKDKFCDKCHNEVGVNPYCFSCHNLAPVKKEPVKEGGDK